MERRITIDLDKPSVYHCLWTAIKGSILCRSLPEIRMTQKGWHQIWFTKRAKTEDDIFDLRKRIGDDYKRLGIDMSGDIRNRQVLFSHGAKNVSMPGFIYANLLDKTNVKHPEKPLIEVRPSGREVPYYETCPCGKKIDVAYSFWDKLEDKYCIEVHHGDSSCDFPLRHGVPLLLRRCVGLN